MRGGVDARVGKGAHKLLTVHREMHLQICRDYQALPDPRTLTLSEIRYFYEGLRLELHERTRAK